MNLSRWWVAVCWLAAAVLVGSTQAADSLKGPYKFAFLTEGQMPAFWLIEFEQKDGKWEGKMAAAAPGVPDAKIENVSLKDDVLRFTLKIPQNTLAFEGKLPKEEGGKILGTIAMGQQMVPAELESTKVKDLSATELNKELLDKPNPGPVAFNAAINLLRKATEMKADPAEVRKWASRAYKLSEQHGPRWQLEMAGRIADALVEQDEFAALAADYAHRAKALIDADPDADYRQKIRTLDLVAKAAEAAGKSDDAKAAIQEADQLYRAKVPPFKPEPFAGRKGKSDRVVLVELFTGTDCPPCVAVDVAFDAMLKTYKPSDVVLLQYHLHIPSPDPLSNPDANERSKYYDDEVRGTPTLLINGKLDESAADGGSIRAAHDKYKLFLKLVEPWLETPAKAQLRVRASRKDDRIDIVADASEIEKPGDKVRLRLALVEEEIRFTGQNDVRFHHHVVRAMPGGPDGLALEDKSGKQITNVQIKEVQRILNEHLNDIAKRARFSTRGRPMEFKKLKVVAWIQDDETKEVLQALQVDVEDVK